MPIAEVLDPDGKTIHEFEVPEGATPSQIEDFATKTFSKPANRPQSALKTTSKDAYLANAIEGVPFGADIAATFDAIRNPSDKSFGERQKVAKALMEDAAKAGMDQHKVAAIAGMVTGGLSTTPLVPARALQGASVAARMMKGVGVGGGIGAVYGAGEGNSLGERASNSITGAVLGAPLGGGGALAVDAIGAGYRASRNLAQRAIDLVKNRSSGGNGAAANRASAAATQQAGGSTESAYTPLQRALDSSPKVEAPAGPVVPLTQGQASQNPKLQSLEAGAAAGIHGEEAQRAMNEVRTLQSDKAKEAISSLAGKELTPNVPGDVSADLVTNLRSAYKAAKSKTDLAYKKVGELAGDEPLMVAADYVRDGVMPAFREWAQKGRNGRAWDLSGRGMEEAKRLYSQADEFSKNTKMNAADFFKMEDWRSAVSQGIENSTTPAEKAFLSGMLQRYDTAMKQLPREAILSGDEQILTAMEKARSSRKEQGILFERSKLVRDIVQNYDITNEQFANSIMSLGPKAGSYVRDVLRTASIDPVKQAELQSQIKQSILGSVVNKSLLAEVKAGGTVEDGVEKMISFDKLATNLDKFTSNKTLFEKVLPEAKDREVIKQLQNAADLIKSQKPGTKNYSNSAYTILNTIRAISPSASSANVMGVGVGKAFQAMGREGALNELNQSIAPVLKGIADQATGPVTNFGKKYGRKIMAGGMGTVSSKSIKDTIGEPQETDIPHITITPKREAK